MMSDLIENLPDIMLLHILSFLPTKEAVATSILSKRWRPFWQSLPILAIRDVDFHAYDLEVFVQFVDDVLLLGNLKFLNTFSLTCWTIRVPYEKLSSWINALIQSRVESIEIWFPSSFNTKLPSNMFNSKAMKVLKLNGITFDSLRAVSLPCLTVLYFDNVRCADLNCVAVLVSGCPILETLVFKSLDTKHYGPMLDVGKLDHLVAARVPPSLLPWKALANVRFLSLRSTWIPGAMHAAWSPAGDIPTLYNLTYLECYSNMWTRMVNYLHSFPKLQNLVISEVGFTPPNEPILSIPPCISSQLKKFTLDANSFSDREFEFAKFIMKNARVLRTVRIGKWCPPVVLGTLSSYPTASENCRVLCDEFSGSPVKEWDCCVKF